MAHAYLLYKNDDKLCVCTVDIAIDVCLLILFSLSLMMDVNSMSMSILMLPMLKSVRDAFHPCVRCRLALDYEKARLRRLIYTEGRKLSVQTPDDPDPKKPD